ncbi:hypothetical protein CR532_04835 (plasmid) [Candidatus Borreliella tachyglossi]|uniref:Lipoprotein n=1 Tax=Candidatus Borreliella tachyglossi TaxID=1964448 RepID=A0A2S1LYG5_9SPIR|nr:hypothetical protein [Candidatus Borreliella tachyglossi]AWG43326.1 hypothetical protein CR532_04835 [Candidatus Borreliella tachyglossi]
MGKRLIFILICIIMLACAQDIKKTLPPSMADTLTPDQTTTTAADTLTPAQTTTTAADTLTPAQTTTTAADTLTPAQTTTTDDKIAEERRIREEKMREGHRIQILEDNLPVDYYATEEHAIKDINPLADNISMDFGRLRISERYITNQAGQTKPVQLNANYPIIQRANLTHFKILVDKLELNSMGIHNLDALISEDHLIETLRSNNENSLLLMLYSKVNNQEYIILPLSKAFQQDINKAFNKASVNISHNIKLKINKDSDNYSVIKFATINPNSAVSISIETNQYFISQQLTKYKLILSKKFEYLLEELVDNVYAIKNLMKTPFVGY